MKLRYGTSSVLDNVEISSGVFKLTIKVDFCAKPGEILFLKSKERRPFLSRPLEVYGTGNGKIEFIYKSRETNLIDKLEKDDEVEVICPLGHKIRETGVSA